MKKINKMFLSAIGVFFLGIIFIFTSLKTEAATIIGQGYDADLKVFFSKDVLVAEDLSNVITEVDPGDEFYVTVVLETTKTINSFGGTWPLDYSNEVESATNLLKNGNMTGDTELTGLLNTLYPPYGAMGYFNGMAMMLNRTTTIDATGKTLLSAVGMGFTNNTPSAADPRVFLQENSVSEAAANNYVVTKLKIKLKNTATSFNFNTSEIIMGNNSGSATYGKDSDPSKMVNASLNVSGGASDAVDLTTKTYKGSADSVATLSGSSTTLTGAVSAASTTAQLNLAVKDGGTVTSVAVSNGVGSVSGSGGSYTVTLGGTNTTTKLTVNVTAKNGVNTETYTINLTRNKYATASLSGITFSNPQGSSMTPALYSNSNGTTATSFSSGVKTYYLKISSATTSYDITPTVTGNQNAQGYKVNNGTLKSSGSISTITSNLSNGSQLVVSAIAEDGTSVDYTFNIISVTSDTTPKTVSISSNTGTVLGNATWSQSDNAYVLNNVAYSVGGFCFAVTPTKSNTTISVGGSTLASGASSSNTMFPTGTTGIQGTASFSIKDNDTGDSDTYNIIVKRKDASTDNSIPANGFVISVGGTTYTGTYNPATGTYTIPSGTGGLPIGTTSADVTIKPTDPNAKVSINGGTFVTAGTSGATGQVTVSTTQDPTTFKVSVQAEDGSAPKEYTIELGQGPKDQDSTINASNGILVRNFALNTTYSGNLSGTTYTLNTLAYTVNGFAVTVNLSKTTSSWQLYSNGTAIAAGTNASGATSNYTFDNVGTKKAITNGVVTVRVFAQDGSHTDYTISFTRAGADSSTEISGINSNGVVIKHGSTTYQYAYQAASGTNSASNPHILVLSQNVAYKYNDLDVTVTLVKNTGSIYIASVLTLNGDARNVTIGTANDKGELPIAIDIKIVAEDGTEGFYQIQGKRVKANDNNEIATNGLVITADSNDGAFETKTYSPITNGYVIDGTLPGLTSKIRIRISLAASAFATMTIEGDPVQSGDTYEYSIPSHTTTLNKQIKVVITAEDGSQKTVYIEYTADAASTDATILSNSLDIVDSDGNNYNNGTWSGNTYTINNVPFKYNTLDVKVTPNSSVAKLFKADGTTTWTAGTYDTWTIGTSATYNATRTEFKFTIKPESGSAVEYKLVCNRVKAKDDNTVQIGVTGATTGNTYTTYTPANAITGVNYYLVKESNDPNVKFTFGVSDTDSTTIEFSTNGAGGTFATWENTVASSAYKIGASYWVKITPENKNAAMTYTISVHKADERNDDTKLLSLILKDSNGNVVAEKNGLTFDPANPKTYTFEVAYKGTYTVEYVLSDTSGAKLYSDKNQSAPVLSFKSEDLGTTGGSYSYYVKAENDSWSNPYIIKLERAEADTKAYLTNLTINGLVPTGFIGDGTELKDTYTVQLNRIVTALNVSYTAVSPAVATRTDTYGGSLSNGYAKVEITVQGEATTAVKKYTIYVYAAETDKDITGIQILDKNNSVIMSNGTVTYAEDLKDENGDNYYDFSSAQAGIPVTFTVPYSVDEVYLYVQTNALNGKTYKEVDGAQSEKSGYIKLKANGNTTISTYVISEYGIMNSDVTADETCTPYIIRIQREARNTEVRLDTFTATGIAASDITFSPDNESIIIQKVGSSLANLPVVITLKSNTSTAMIRSTAGLSASVPITYADSNVGGGIFTFPITVTAESISGDTPITKTYTVTVYRDSIDLKDNVEINAINIVDADGTNYGIDMTTYTGPLSQEIAGTVSSAIVTISVPTAALSNPTLKFTNPDGITTTYTGASLPATISLKTGENKFEVYVVAQDGTTESTHYFLTLKKKELSKVNTIDSIIIDGQTINNPSTTGKNPITIAGDRTSIPVVVNPTDSNSKVTIIPSLDANGNVAVTPGTNTITVLVQSEDPTIDPASYTFEVSIDEDPKLDNLEVKDYTMTPTFTPTGDSYAVTIPYDANSIEVLYGFPTTTDPSLLTVKIDGQTVSSGNYIVQIPSSKDVEVEIIPKSGTNIQKYTISVTKESALTGKDLLSIEFNGVVYPNLNPSVTSGYIIPTQRTAGSMTMGNATASDGAEVILPTNLSLTAGQNNKKVVTVKAQDGTTKDYTFEFVCADTDASITDIQIANTNGTAFTDLDNKSMVFNTLTNLYGFKVKNTVNSLDVTVTTGEVYSTLYYNGVAVNKNGTVYSVVEKLLNEGSTLNTIKVYALSEYDVIMNTTTSKTMEYVIEITRNPLNNDATLKKLEVMINGVNYIVDFSPTKFTGYIISNIGNSVTSLTINADPTDSSANVYGAGNKQLDTGTDISAYIFPFSIEVTAEDGVTKNTYEIKVARGAITDPKDDNTFYGFDVIDSNGVLHFDHTKDFNVTNYGVYEVTIPVGNSSYTINGFTMSGVASKFNISVDATGAVFTDLSKMFVITNDMLGTTINYTLYVQSESGIDGSKYQLAITLTKPSEDATLDQLTVDGVSVPNFDPEKLGPYVISRENEVASVFIQAKTTDGKATIAPTSHLGTQIINEGNSNIFNIIVTAEDGKTTKTYTIQVNKAYAAPKLTSLGVSGEILLDENGKATTFDPETFNYNVVVVFYHETADIFATSDNSTDIISGTGVKTLYVGSQEAIVTVTNVYGISTEYKLTIRRLSSETTNSTAASAYITEIPAFEGDFNPLQTNGYEYTVANKITSLNVVFTPENMGTANTNKATVSYVGNDHLYVGVNNIVVIITAADGSTTTTYVVRVTRSPLNFDIDKDAYEDFTVEEDENGELTYSISIGKMSAADVDFTKYINDLSPADQDLQVEVLTDTSTNPDEVLLRVTDGTNSSIVKFIVNSDLNKGGISIQDLLPLFICLGIVLLILIAILIAVNKDKYGRIVKKSSKKQEKADKTEELNQ